MRGSYELRFKDGTVGTDARTLDPLQFLLVAIAGWINQRQLQVIE
jgi:hypothetical protein